MPVRPPLCDITSEQPLHQKLFLHFIVYEAQKARNYLLSSSSYWPQTPSQFWLSKLWLSEFKITYPLTWQSYFYGPSLQKSRHQGCGATELTDISHMGVGFEENEKSPDWGGKQAREAARAALDLLRWRQAPTVLGNIKQVWERQTDRSVKSGFLSVCRFKY